MNRTNTQASSVVFDWFCPVTTFSNIDKSTKNKILDYESNIVTSGLWGERGDEIHLPDFLEKAKLCYLMVCSVFSKQNPNSDKIMTIKVFDSFYQLMCEEAIEIGKAIAENKGITVRGEDTGEKIDILACIREHKALDQKFLIFYEIMANRPNAPDRPYLVEATSAFSALQYFDGLIGSIKFGEPEWGLLDSAQFHDCYVSAIEYDQIASESDSRRNRVRTVSATQTKSKRTKQRDEYILKLYGESKLSRVDFSSHEETIKKVNIMSARIGLSPLSKDGGRDKFYRMLKGR